MKITIRRPKTKDWKVIQKLNSQVFLSDKNNDDDLDLNWPYSESGVKYYKELASGKYGHCLIAYLDSKAVGYIAVAVKKFGYRNSKHVEVENIGVDPEYRSQGIGKQLMDSATKWAKTNGATKLYVVAYWGNKKAINFYKKSNFYELGLELEKKI